MLTISLQICRVGVCNVLDNQPLFTIVITVFHPLFLSKQFEVSPVITFEDELTSVTSVTSFNSDTSLATKVKLMTNINKMNKLHYTYIHR